MERAHSLKTSEGMDRETILLASSQINIGESDKATMKGNQTGQKTVQLKRNVPFVFSICLNETTKVETVVMFNNATGEIRE